VREERDMGATVKTYAGFVVGAANMKVSAAQAVALYVKKRTESKSEVLTRIAADLKSGQIDRERFDRLNELAEKLHELWMKTGRIVDERDPRDWKDLGNGARMRKKHLEFEKS
jgi:hypothetical protein